MTGAAEQSGERATRAGGLPIVHVAEDRSFVVVNKPAGLLSVPGRGAERDPAKADCVTSRVRAAFPEAAGPMVVHRLDMETSGLMVVALTRRAQRELSGLFERRRVRKRYVALLGAAAKASEAEASERVQRLRAMGRGEVTAAVRLDPDDRPRQVYDPRRGKPTLTRWRVLRDEERPGTFAAEARVDRSVVRVEFEPVTGRSHQLRVHAALEADAGGGGEAGGGGLGLPIKGDTLYGAGVGRADETGAVSRAPRPASAVGPLRLHAWRLRIDEVALDVSCERAS